MDTNAEASAMRLREGEMLSRNHNRAIILLATHLALVVLVGGLLVGCVPLPQLLVRPSTVLATTQPAAAKVSEPTSPAAPVLTSESKLPAGMPTPAPGQHVHVTDHFVIYYTDELPAAQLPALAEKLETAWDKIPVFLGVDPPSKPIRVYTGLHVSFGGWGLPEGVIVLHPSTLELKAYSVVSHEFTHVLTGYSGPPWMEEGLAVYMQEQFPLGDEREPRISADSWSIALLEAGKWIPPWEGFIGITEQPDPQQDFDTFRFYQESGSFVKYLIETYGLAPFWKMHDDLNWWYAAQEVYGKPMDTLLAECQQHLEASTIPPEECPECISLYLDRSDIDITAYQHKDQLSSETQKRIDGELKAAGGAFLRLDAKGMQRHVQAARALLDTALQKSR